MHLKDSGTKVARLGFAWGKTDVIPCPASSWLSTRAAASASAPVPMGAAIQSLNRAAQLCPSCFSAAVWCPGDARTLQKGCSLGSARFLGRFIVPRSCCRALVRGSCPWEAPCAYPAQCAPSPPAAKVWNKGGFQAFWALDRNLLVRSLHRPADSSAGFLQAGCPARALEVGHWPRDLGWQWHGAGREQPKQVGTLRSSGKLEGNLFFFFFFFLGYAKSRQFG